jgi:hypothetical protein
MTYQRQVHGKLVRIDGVDWDYFVPMFPAVCRIQYYGLMHLESGIRERQELLRLPSANASNDEWRKARSAVFGLVPDKSHIGRYLWKGCLRNRYSDRFKEWDECSGLSDQIREWASRELDAHSADEDCRDNWRVARLGNRNQMRRYRRQKENGCCGEAEFFLTGPDGHNYVLGYNYGH